MARPGDYRYPPPPQQFPQPAPPPGGVNAEWSTGLCHSCKSCDDVCLWCVTLCCPCITFGKIAEIVDRGTMPRSLSCALYCLLCCTGFQWIYTGLYRSKLRALFRLVESPCNDFIVHYCCTNCALRQEYRELRNRGFDMNTGWHANVQRMQVAIASGGENMPPVVNSGMSR